MYFTIFLFVRNALDNFLGYRKKEIFEGIFFRNTDWALPGQKMEEGDFLLLCGAFVSLRDFLLKTRKQMMGTSSKAWETGKCSGDHVFSWLVHIFVHI